MKKKRRQKTRPRRRRKTPRPGPMFGLRPDEPSKAWWKYAQKYDQKQDHSI